MKRANTSLAAGFEGSLFGDKRRDERFRSMVATVARCPSGKVSKCFRRPAEQQGAYDFLEHDRVSAAQVQAVAARATARLCGEHPFVYLAVDGSSYALTDMEQTKGFGSIGPRKHGARGLKMMNALALTPDGQTIGMVGQVFWARGAKSQKGYRALAKRESVRWHEAVDYAVEALKRDAPETKVHVLADREADASLFMQHLLEVGCEFTVRANGNRKVLSEGRRVLVRRHLKKAKALGTYMLELPQRTGTPSRDATLTIRAAHVVMVMRDHHTQQRKEVPLTVVWALEEDAPRGVEPIDWMLYTTSPAQSVTDATAALRRYARRWKIEDLHKMLKSGGGCVEDSQLRSVEAVIKWATIHAIVASRAQRLRDLARTDPEAPASTELSEVEIEALVLLKRHEKRKNETITATGLPIGRAVRWLGDLGGFTATGASKKMPGSTVICRGLERVLEAVLVLEALRANGEIR